jgi:hypothetical protein
MWSHTLKEGHKLQVFESKVLRKIYGQNNDEVGSLRYYIVRVFVIYTGQPLLLA